MTALLIAIELATAVLLSAAIAGALAWYAGDLGKILPGRWRRER